MDSANFWPLRPTIGGCRESSVFRYLTDLNTEFPYVYQKALSLVLAQSIHSARQKPSSMERDFVPLIAVSKSNAGWG